MADSMESEGHRREIVEQFTRQAAPFAKLHSVDETVAMMMAAGGVTGEDRVLDVACGPGLVACGFAARARVVVGIDLTPAMIEKGEALARERGLANVSWRVGDVGKLPFEAGEFSVVVSRYAMHHLEEPGRAVAERARVCAAGGRVVVADVYMTSAEQGDAYDAMEKLRDPSHARAVGLEAFREMFATAGIEDVRTQFCRFEVAVEQLLTATCTPAEEGARVREMVAGDVGVDRMGIAARRVGDALWFSFPIVVISGVRGR